VIECTGCHTLNPAAERACLVCGAALPGPGQTASSPSGGARCPAGHPVNPAWTSCPYCDRQQAAAGSPPPQHATRLEGAFAAPAAQPGRTRLEPGAAPAPQVPFARPTRLEEPAEPLAGRRTVLHEGATTGAPVNRLVAALAAPSLGAGGMVFPVRTGKNAIGADRSNDVVLAGDPEVSREHASLLVRNGLFLLADRQSTNGTRVNGCDVPAGAPVEIHDRDHIRCGTTDLVFLMVDAGPG